MNLGKSLAAIFALLFCTCFVVEGGRKTPLHNPEPIIVPDGMTMESVRDAIEGATLAKGWAKGVKKNGLPEKIEVTYIVKNYKAILDVEYDEDYVRFSYNDSVELNYQENEQEALIHPIYNLWVKEFAAQVRVNVESGNSYSLEDDILKMKTSMNLPPKEIFSQFSDFVLKPSTLDEFFQEHASNKKALGNLDHRLNRELLPFLKKVSKRSTGQRSLIIQPHVESIRFIGVAARVLSGPAGSSLLGRSWIHVRVDFIDEASGEIIAQPHLFRKGSNNGLLATRGDYKVIEVMAKDIMVYFKNNYDTPLGGGICPPVEIRNAEWEE